MPRAPLPGRSVIPFGTASWAVWESVTSPSSLVRAHAPDLVPSRAFGYPVDHEVLAGCLQSLLRRGPSRHCPCTPCVVAWTHTPPSTPGALTQVLPRGLRPRATGTTLGGWNCPCTATSAGSRLSGRQSFASLQASALARPPGCSDRGAPRRAAGPFTPRIPWAVIRSRVWRRFVSDLGD